MSAALQLPAIWATQTSISIGAEALESTAQSPPIDSEHEIVADSVPEISLAFYRKHTEKTLRRYLYASMLVGRAPSILGEPVSRGFVSCRRIKTFEDAIIFVLDIERCLKQLSVFDRAIISRVTLQEYTYPETAALLGVSHRTVCNKYPIALDRLTELLRSSGLLILPHS